MNVPLPTPGVLPLEQARVLVEDHAALIEVAKTEAVPLLDSAGRVLAQEIRADRDFPPFPRSTRDGYAVRAIDVSSLPARLTVIGEVRAGNPTTQGALAIHAGEAAAIMTGAAVPEGADAVVMIEYTVRKGETVAVERTVEAGDNIVPQGVEACAGEVLLTPGSRIDHGAIAVAASVGLAEIRVYAKPRVAILASGDEIVGITEQPSPGQIRNSNTYSLAAQVRSAGGEPVLLPIAPDEPIGLRDLLREGLNADLLLVAGGVSAGKYDLVEKVLAELKAEFFFTGALIQPGRPVVFGRAQGKYFLGLPGNPVSTMVTFELFARPLIDALCGARVEKLRFFQAKLKSDIRTKTGLTRFLPGKLSGEYRSTLVELVPWKGSGDIIAAAHANCYIVVPRNRDHIFAEETVDVMLAKIG
jgi:molybdopterin molybdotransferase